MKKLLIATTNEGKKKELLAFLKLENTEILTLKDFPTVDDVEETGTTFEENAKIKAKYFGNIFNIKTLGEDSGIMIEAFPENFGVYTRRAISEEVGEKWLKKFLEIMAPQKNRRASFYSAMCFYDPEKNTEHTVLGKVSGTLTEQPLSEIEKGIEISSVFLADGETKVFSAMTHEEKNKISHRGNAAKKMMEYWESSNL